MADGSQLTADSSQSESLGRLGGPDKKPFHGGYFQSKRLKIEAVAENHFGDEMIGGRGDANAEAEVHLPLRR